MDIDGNARIAERLFEIGVKGHVRADDEIGLQGEDLLYVGLVDDADFLSLRRLLLDRLRQCLRSRLADDEVCASRRDEEIEVRSVQYDDALRVRGHGDFAPHAVLRRQLLRLRRFLRTRQEDEDDSRREAQERDDDTKLSH